MSAKESKLGSGSFEIALPELAEAAEEFCLANLRLDKQTLSGKKQRLFEQTGAAVQERFVCKGMYAGFAIERIGEREGCPHCGKVLESPVLAKALSGAEEVAVFAVAVHGFEELCSSAEDSMLDVMFYNGWGVGYSTGSQQWLEETIRQRAHEVGLYSGRSWCPGEDDVEMDLQVPLASMIDVSKVGVDISDNFIMRPMMSVTGFIAVSPDADIEQQKTSFMV